MHFLATIIISISFVICVHSFAFSFTRMKIQNINRNKIIPLNCYNEEYPFDCENVTINELHKTLYILIWEKSPKAYNLLSEMEKQGLHTVFIPEDELDIMRLTTSDMPMVFKEDVLLESRMDIYAEMYPM